MSEWDEWETGKKTPTSSKQISNRNVNKNSFQGGSLHVTQTVVAFLSTACASFLVAWLSRNVETRPMWLLACSFAMPVLALMGSVLLVEKSTRAMTPKVSGKAQTVVVAISVVLAALTGMFCQFTNKEAAEPVKTIVGNGWSDTIIVMDKSGSMYGSSDRYASQAVKDLLNGMDASTNVGFIAYSNDIEGEVQIGALTDEHKQKILNVAGQEPGGGTDFSTAIAEANKMIANWGSSDSQVSIIFVTDGEDTSFSATPYLQDMISNSVTLNYIRVGAESNKEMERLVSATSGKSISTTDASSLLSEMQSVVLVPQYVYEQKDALRNIDESSTAKLVVGLLLLVQGIMNGVALTIMFSRQGQRRLQLFLSPLLAVGAFCILAFGKQVLPVAWIREGVAFSMLGIVLMRKNNNAKSKQPIQQKKPETVVDENW